MFNEVDLAIDADGRRWPMLSSAPQNRDSELEGAIAKLSAELNLRCTQVADFCNIQQQQANEILAACDEIDRLGESIDTLQDTARQREKEAAATAQKILLLDKENITLRLQFETALKESAELLQRLLGAETATNNREIAVVSAQELNSQLKAELTASRKKAIGLAAEIEKGNRQHRDEVDQQSAQFKDQIRKIAAVAADRNMQVRYLEVARANLTSRCDELAKAVDALESKNANAQSKFISQAVKVFNKVLREEREFCGN